MSRIVEAEGIADLADLQRFKDEQALGLKDEVLAYAAHHLNKRGGVVIGNVVGLGKSIMASASANVSPV